jgi:hypothetical protein
MPVPTAPTTFACLQAMQSIILSECLVASASPFAALSAADQARFGVARAVFIGKPKDFADAYLPQCHIWLPPGEEAAQQVEWVGYAGRVFGEVEARVTVYVDLRTDWYAREQTMLSIVDALWPAILHHEQLGGTVATVIESDATEGKGLGYEQVAGVEYRTYEALWWVRQQWNIAGGRLI